MTFTAPPCTPDTGNDRDLEQRVGELEALIEEARRRARRRRRLYAAVVLAAIAAGAAASFGIGGGPGVSPGRSAAEGSPGSSAAQPGEGRWRLSHGPEGGYVEALAVDPGDPEILYAGGSGNVYKSTNGGANWRDVTAQPWTRVSALAIDPTRPGIVYAGTERGIAKTVDGGRRWRMVNAGLFDHETAQQRGGRLAEGFLSALVIDAHSPETVFAVTDRGLFRTTDGGSRWRIIGPPLASLYGHNCAGLFCYAMAVAIDPDRASTVYASWNVAGGRFRPGLGRFANLYKSIDGGDSWHPIDVRGHYVFSSLAVDHTTPGTIFGTDGSSPGVLRSTDDGATWRLAGLPGQMVYDLRLDPGSRGTLYANTAGGMFKMSDGGTTWRKTAIPAYGAVVTDPNDPRTIYGIGGHGVRKSVDGGRTWRSANAGLVATDADSLVLAPGSSKILYAAGCAGVSKSTDGGLTWRPADSGLGKCALALAISPGAIYAGTWSTVFKSTDGGLRWRPSNAGLPVQTPGSAGYNVTLAVDPRRPGTVYAGLGGRGVFKTVDGGATWRPTAALKAGPQRRGYVQTLAVDPRADDTVFAGSTRGLFRSKDGGDQWQLVATAPRHPRSHFTDPSTFVAIAFDRLDPTIVYAGIRTRGIMKSSDGGDTWAASNTGLTDKQIASLVVDPRDPQIVYASAWDGGVFRSTDGARSWRRFDRGLPRYPVLALAIDPAGRTLFAGTGGGGVVDLRLAR